MSNTWTFVLGNSTGVNIAGTINDPGSTISFGMVNIDDIFWIYGGIDNLQNSHITSDLWTFNTNSLEWTLIGGSFEGDLAITNYTAPYFWPGGVQYNIMWRSGHIIWMTGGNGHTNTSNRKHFVHSLFLEYLFLFVTCVVLNNKLAALWAYDTFNGTWSLHSDYFIREEPELPETIPGPGWYAGKQSSAAWIVNGTLWLFGGLEQYGMISFITSFIFSCNVTQL